MDQFMDALPLESPSSAWPSSTTIWNESTGTPPLEPKTYNYHSYFRNLGQHSSFWATLFDSFLSWVILSSKASRSERQRWEVLDNSKEIFSGQAASQQQCEETLDKA